MSEINYFLIASRHQYRFSSVRGDLVVEQLWDVPLASNNGFSLNDIAIAINNELKSLQEESFVEVSPNPRRDDLRGMLEIVKTVIAIKQEEKAKKAEAAERATMRRQIMDAIREKEQQNLTSASIDELKERLAALEPA